jgi:predicted nucleotidyltransferase
MITNIATVLALLPSQTRARVEGFSRAAQDALGHDLAALIVYGSAVRGGLTPRSDVDIIAVLRTDHADVLRSLHDAAAIARAAARVDLRIMLLDEIPRAADVFPIFFDDVRGCHAVLFGHDPFKDLVIHDEHRRLRVEQELREARMALRRLVVDHAFDTSALRADVQGLVKRIRAPLHSLLHLHNSSSRDDLVTVLDITGRRLGADTLPLTSSDQDPVAIADACAVLLDKAIDDVDQLSARGH